MTPPINPLLCPLCGKPNACRHGRAASEGDASPCWCRDEHIPRELLARIPEAARDRACLCRECITAWKRERTPARPAPAPPTSL